MSEELPLRSNVPEFSVSEIAFSLKRTIEENYSRVRVRGELSRVSIPKSGHLYTALKDDKSVIDAVCWKGVLSKLPLQPEEGLEVICTGRITTYPARSNYQLVIETMELAGEGALLKMLEDRKKKLAQEGLFAAERKKPLPFLPNRIGVVTSPTGAVIRDILHRLADRFPRHVMVWPVKVQGDGAAVEIENAIEGFNALPLDQRPDLLIVARGGGSLEDLMPFNEEGVVRAVANCSIPVISAVGHETDTTLVDYAADLRAPTPTGAAEKAVPVRMELLARLSDDHQRLIGAMGRGLVQRKHKLDAASAKLIDPARLLELKIQNLDHVGDRLNHSHEKLIARKQHNLTVRAARLIPPRVLVEKKRALFERASDKIDSAVALVMKDKKSGLEKAHEKLELLSFENVLKRGFVVVRDENERPVTVASALTEGQSVRLQFKDNERVNVSVGTGDNIPKPDKTEKVAQKKKLSSKREDKDQHSLF